MRIAFLSHYAELYGANRSLLGLISGLSRFVVEPVVYCPKKGAFTEALSEL